MKRVTASPVSGLSIFSMMTLGSFCAFGLSFRAPPRNQREAIQERARGMAEISLKRKRGRYAILALANGEPVQIGLLDFAHGHHYRFALISPLRRNRSGGACPERSRMGSG